MGSTGVNTGLTSCTRWPKEKAKVLFLLLRRIALLGKSNLGPHFIAPHMPPKMQNTMATPAIMTPIITPGFSFLVSLLVLSLSVGGSVGCHCTICGGTVASGTTSTVTTGTDAVTPVAVTPVFLHNAFLKSPANFSLAWGSS